MSSKKPREIRLTNSLTGRKEILETLEPGRLSMYSCGPTVYNLIHIGNLRGGLVADMFFRYFKRVGYDVTYVRNYTDVDDKIIARGHEEKISAEEVARKYTQEVEKDYAVSGMLEPTHKTSVTTHISEIISMIERIIANGKGYVSPSGEVLFAIDEFEGYGKLSRRNLEDLEAGLRIEVKDYKRNPLDFSLWKPAKAGEPAWDSPWGKGRPGWHIECSAMASKWLGDRIDVHHGGSDLIFPHHENEIAQSEAASNQAPFVKYWLHHAFVMMSNEKMSKSIGNVFSAREFLTLYGGEFARYMLLSSHYRSLIDFSEETIDHSVTSLSRIYEAKSKAKQLTALKAAVPDSRAEAAWGQFAAECEATEREVDEQLAHDFNTAGALAALFKLIREFNRTTSEPLAMATPSAVLGAELLIRLMEDDIGGIIGVGRSDPEKMLKDLEKIRLTLPRTGAPARPTEDEIKSAIQARADARAGKNFADADRIRKDLEARGVLIKDSPQGTTWTYH